MNGQIRRICGAVLAVGLLVLVATIWGAEPTVEAVAASEPGTVVTTIAPAPEPSTSAVPTATVAPPPTIPPEEILPESGWGRRVVYSIGRQRMWWVDDGGNPIRTALVSGRAATPTTGVFQVFSRTEDATGFDGSKMDKFVRFTRGTSGWAIGFHGIPRMDGQPVQSEEQLGEPLSHGCIRQSAEDTAFTWDFLHEGDYVVVVT